MPELPEVEVCRLGIAPHIENRIVARVTVRQKQLRWPIPDEVSLLSGQKLLSVSRRSKYLMLRFASGTLLIHLGMSGTVRILPTTTPAVKHDHFELAFEHGQMLRLNDPRRFGAVLWLADHLDEDGVLAKLGPEPLSDEFNAEYLMGKAKNRSVPIKTFLMNNQIVVGVGNIYANEALFTAAIRPDTKTGSLKPKQLTLLTQCIKDVLVQAIKQGGTTLKDFTQADGKPGYFAQELRVYGRAKQPCVVCSAPLVEIRQGGRSSVFCEQCQK